MSELSANAFERVTQTQDIQGISRPSLSYWQDAWIRLKANRRALISLYIVIGLLLFTFFGPLVWNVDPAKQDVDQISQPPGANRSVTLVEEFSQWSGADIAVTEPIAFAQPPTTQAVRLVWQAMPGASGYRVYRNIFPTGPQLAYGLPLAALPGSQTYFEDRLDLSPREFFYTVVALDENGKTLRKPSP